MAVCDDPPAALAAAVAKTGAAGFDSLDALLAGSNADVVVLAAPAACTRCRPCAPPPTAATC